MPRLRRLSGRELIRIVESLGFELRSVKGSHHKFVRHVEGKTQVVIIPIHGGKDLDSGMLHQIYKDLLRYVPASELKPLFYTD
jgi:predicted RNA binding protein YcfA (HicA-like mRNA interferase family)